MSEGTQVKWQDLKASEYKLLFSLEVDIDTMKYRLGGYMCVPWPEVLHPLTEDDVPALRATLGCIGVMLDEVAGFHRYTVLRSQFDTKTKGPFIVTSNTPVSKDDFAEMIDGLTTEEVMTMFINEPESHFDPKLKITTH